MPAHPRQVDPADIQPVVDAVEQWQASRESADDARRRMGHALLAAVEKGVPVTQIAAATGLSVPYAYELRRRAEAGKL